MSRQLIASFFIMAAAIYSLLFFDNCNSSIFQRCNIRASADQTWIILPFSVADSMQFCLSPSRTSSAFLILRYGSICIRSFVLLPENPLFRILPDEFESHHLRLIPIHFRLPL